MIGVVVDELTIRVFLEIGRVAEVGEDSWIGCRPPRVKKSHKESARGNREASPPDAVQGSGQVPGEKGGHLAQDVRGCTGEPQSGTSNIQAESITLN